MKEHARHGWTRSSQSLWDASGWWSHAHYDSPAFKAQSIVLAFVVVRSERRTVESHDPHTDRQGDSESLLLLFLLLHHAGCGLVAVICDGYQGVLGGTTLHPHPTSDHQQEASDLRSASQPCRTGSPAKLLLHFLLVQSCDDMQ